jgi:hypothetical protein
MNLDSMMQVDKVIHIDADEYVCENLRGVPAPEVYVECDTEGNVISSASVWAQSRAREQGWSLLTGWSEYYLLGARFLMHPTEYISGGLAEHILSNPGYYCTVLVTDDSGEAGWSDGKNHVKGWAVAYRKTI